MAESEWVLEHIHDVTGCPACAARMDEEESVLLEARPALLCALCLYAPPKKPDPVTLAELLAEDLVASPAITVIEGYATCEEHMGYLAEGSTFASLLNAMKRDHPTVGHLRINDEPQ